MKSPEKVVDHITNWLKNYLRISKMKGFVVGVSGGIDSAVTSALCARTGASVLCLEMAIHQEENQVSRALDHIQWLKKSYKNVSHHSLELTPVFESVIECLPPTAKR